MKKVRDRIYEYTTANGDVRYQARNRRKNYCKDACFDRITDAQAFLRRTDGEYENLKASGILNATPAQYWKMKDAIEIFRTKRLPKLTGERNWGYLLGSVEKFLGETSLVTVDALTIERAMEEYRRHTLPNLTRAIEAYRAEGRDGVPKSWRKVIVPLFDRYGHLSIKEAAEKCREHEEIELHPKFRPLADSSCNRFATLVAMVLKVARREKMMNHNPMEDVERFDEEVLKRTEAYTEDEFSRLLTAAEECHNPSLPTVLETARMTGLRRETIRNLLKEQINFDTLTIVLPAKRVNARGKKGKPRPRTVPIAKELAVILQKHLAILEIARVKSPFVFPSPQDANVPWDFNSAFRNAIKRAGLKNRRFHDIRHYSGTCLAEAEAPTHVITTFYNHSDPKMTLRYVNHSEGTIRKYVDKAFSEKDATESYSEDI